MGIPPIISWNLAVIFVMIASSYGVSGKVGSGLIQATLRRELTGGAFVAVFDDLLSDDTLSSLKDYGNFFVRWETGTEGAQQCGGSGGEDGHSQSREPCQGQRSPATPTPWAGRGDPHWFVGTQTWRRLLGAVIHANNGSSQAFYPYSVRTELLRRGDNVAPGDVMLTRYSRELALRIFLVPEWQMNDYGDMSFYTPAKQNRTNGSQYEIEWTLRPHPGRVIVWDTSIPTLYRPPSMGFIQALLSVTVLLTPSREKFDKACQVWKEWEQMKTQQMEQSFPHLPEPVGQLDVGSHLVRSFADNKGRKVMVFDGLLDDDHLETLTRFLIDNPRASPYPYSLESYEESDNVAWIKTFDAMEFAKSSTWDVLSQVANFIGGEPRTWHPYDVSVNVVHSADHPRVHEDCEEWEHEYTMVMYLNRDLEAGHYGETLFYNREPLDEYSSKLYQGISMYNYDAIGAVRPKYGRVAIFNGLISHSARPPSTAYNGPRYTFAVKVAASRKIAVMKQLRERLEESPEEDVNQQTLAEELQTEASRGQQTHRSEEWLEAELTKVRETWKRVRAESKQELLEKL